MKSATIPADVVLADDANQVQTLADMVARIFGGDTEKTAIWFRAKNPMLGDFSPQEMLRLGRYDRLRKFIVDAEKETI